MGMTRREFARMGALGAATLSLRNVPLFGQQPASSQAKIGYAIIGLGEIASHFMPGLRMSQHCQVTALVSGHRDKAQRIAAEYNVPASSIYSYEDFDRIRDNKAVDAVYVALPNSMHAEYTARAAKAGKHVLCEKPMAVSVAECEGMIAACKAANVKLMIAYRLHYEPVNRKAIDLIRSGAIGQVQTMESSFGFDIHPGVWRLNRKLAGGGPLADVGIYSLNAMRYLSGEEPDNIRAFASVIDKDGRFTEVEENCSWTMRFPSGILASCATTYGGQMRGFFKVHGSKGWISAEPAFSYDNLKLQAHYAAGGGAKPEEFHIESDYKDPQQFAWEADHLAECIRDDKTPATAGDEGLKDMRYIAEIYRSAGIMNKVS